MDKTLEKKLKRVLRHENDENYSSFEFQSKTVTSHRERLLSRIERAVFGNANIQKKEFEKFILKYPEFKSGLSAYDK